MISILPLLWPLSTIEAQALSYDFCFILCFLFLMDIHENWHNMMSTHLFTEVKQQWAALNSHGTSKNKHVESQQVYHHLDTALSYTDLHKDKDLQQNIWCNLFEEACRPVSLF